MAQRHKGAKAQGLEDEEERGRGGERETGTARPPAFANTFAKASMFKEGFG
jgi:hypothetical protein